MSTLPLATTQQMVLCIVEQVGSWRRLYTYQNSRRQECTPILPSWPECLGGSWRRSTERVPSHMQTLQPSGHPFTPHHAQHACTYPTQAVPVDAHAASMRMGIAPERAGFHSLSTSCRQVHMASVKGRMNYNCASRCISGAWNQQCSMQAFSSLASRHSYYDALSTSIKLDIDRHAATPQTGVSLRYLLDFGTRPLQQQMFQSAHFLHQEIPVRLAHRISDLSRLPPKLAAQPQVQRVKGWYAESFAEMRALPIIREPLDVARFTVTMKSILKRHSSTVPVIAKGVEEYKRACLLAGEAPVDLHAFLDTFFLSRIALRFLAGQHCALFEPPISHSHIGMVHTRCPVVQIVSDAAADARAVCLREHGSAPTVLVHGSSSLTFPYVPSHLQHMVFELVKNSLRALQERAAADDRDDEPPPVNVVIVGGDEDVTIKVSDQGGGIPRSGLPRIWTYLYTTARSPLPDLDPHNTGHVDMSLLPAVLAGYGCGLPLSRLYARYFGGDLQLMSMEGYGTDAFLHLNRLASNDEPLPGQLDS